MPPLSIPQQDQLCAPPPMLALSAPCPAGQGVGASSQELHSALWAVDEQSGTTALATRTAVEIRPGRMVTRCRAVNHGCVTDSGVFLSVPLYTRSKSVKPAPAPYDACARPAPRPIELAPQRSALDRRDRPPRQRDSQGHTRHPQTAVCCSPGRTKRAG
jgi:hypothetical protein